MPAKGKKLELSRETLLVLNDRDLAGAIGGTAPITFDTLLCHTTLCGAVNSHFCDSGVCHSAYHCDSYLCNSGSC